MKHPNDNLATLETKYAPVQQIDNCQSSTNFVLSGTMERAQICHAYAVISKTTDVDTIGRRNVEDAEYLLALSILMDKIEQNDLYVDPINYPLGVIPIDVNDRNHMANAAFFRRLMIERFGKDFPPFLCFKVMYPHMLEEEEDYYLAGLPINIIRYASGLDDSDSASNPQHPPPINTNGLETGLSMINSLEERRMGFLCLQCAALGDEHQLRTTDWMSTPTPLRFSSSIKTPIERNKLTFRSHINKCHKFTEEDVKRGPLVYEREQPIRLSRVKDCFLSTFDVQMAEGIGRPNYVFSSSDGALSTWRGIKEGHSMSFPKEDQHYKRQFRATRPKNSSEVAKRTHVNLRNYCNDYVAKYFKPLEDIGELLNTSLTAIDDIVGRIATHPNSHRDDPTNNRIILYATLFKLNVKKLLEALEKDTCSTTSDGAQQETEQYSPLNGVVPQSSITTFESTSTPNGADARGTQDGVCVPPPVEAIIEDVENSREANCHVMLDHMDISQGDRGIESIDVNSDDMRKKRSSTDLPGSKRLRTGSESMRSGECQGPEVKQSVTHECDSTSDDDIIVIAETLKQKRKGN